MLNPKSSAKPTPPTPVPIPQPQPQPVQSKRVTEEFFNYNLPSIGDLVSPFTNAASGMLNLFPLFPVRRHTSGFSNYLYLTAPQLDLLRWYGRLSFELNEYGRAGLTHLANYCIGPGYSYSAVPVKGQRASRELLNLVDRFLHKFQEKNCWIDNQWERHLYLDARRDGDVFVRFKYDDESGIPRLLKYRGEEVRDELYYTPQWSFGILINLEDLVTPQGWQVWRREEEGQRTEVLQAHEMLRFMNHLEPEDKRGLTDFFCWRDVLEETKKLLRAGRVGETARQAISYVREYAGTNASEVNVIQQQETDYQIPSTEPQGPPTFWNASQIMPGEVHDIPEGLLYKDGPKGDPESVEILIRASLRACSAAWNIPIHLLDGEIDSNFASALVEEGPLFKRIQVDQALAKSRYCNIFKRAIYYGVQWGILPQNTLEVVDINAEAPPIGTRDKKAEQEINESLVAHGAMSIRTMAERADLDYDAEQEQIKAEQLFNPKESEEGQRVDGSHKPTQANSTTDPDSNPHASRGPKDGSTTFGRTRSPSQSSSAIYSRMTERSRL